MAWQQFKTIVPALLYVAAIIIAIRIMPHRSFITTLLVILLGATLAQFINKARKKQAFGLKEIGLTILRTGLIVSAFYLLYMWLGQYGLWGLIAIVIIYSSYVLIRRKKQYIDAVRTVEKQMFGVTLDKNKEGKV